MVLTACFSASVQYVVSIMRHYNENTGMNVSL